MQQKAYLSRKGISPNQPMQLSLLFPDTIGERGDIRQIPNDFARASLFTGRNKREPRRSLMHQNLFSYDDGVVIQFTGTELRAEDDEPVWMQILHYAKHVPFGAHIDFSIKDLVRDLGWHKNGRYYDKARECISRLKASEVRALNSKAYGNTGAISLIHRYEIRNDGAGKPTDYRVWIHEDLILLFAGNTFTSHAWLQYRALSPIARRLADYVESHKHPYPLPLDRFRRMCDSTNTSLFSWRRSVKSACDEIVQAGIVDQAHITETDLITCKKK